MGGEETIIVDGMDKIVEERLEKKVMAEEEWKARKREIKEKVRRRVSLLGTDNLNVTNGVDVGTQCNIGRGTITINKNFNLALLEEMVAANFANALMRDAEDTFHNINPYRYSAFEEVKKLSKKELLRFAFDVCNTPSFKRYNLKQDENRRDTEATYVCAFRVYKKAEELSKKEIKQLTGGKQEELTKEEIKKFNEAFEKQFNREKKAAGLTGALRILFAKDGVVVCEYFPNMPVMEKLKLTAKECLKVGADITKNLYAVHNIGIVHRDVNPRNVFIHITPKGADARLGDWGSMGFDPSKDTDLTKTSVGFGGRLVLASPAFVASEEIYTNINTTKKDIYSLGGVLYWILSGGYTPNQIYSRELAEKEGKAFAIFRNLLNANPKSKEEYKKPPNPLVLRKTYDETLKDIPWWNLFEKAVDYIPKKRRKKELGLLVRRFTKVLAGAMNPNYKRRYTDGTKIVKDKKTGKLRKRKYLAAEQMLDDIRLIMKGEEPEVVYKVARILGTDINSYVNEAFAWKSEYLGRKEYTSVPRLPRELGDYLYTAEEESWLLAIARELGQNSYIKDNFETAADLRELHKHARAKESEEDAKLEVVSYGEKFRKKNLQKSYKKMDMITVMAEMVHAAEKQGYRCSLVKHSKEESNLEQTLKQIRDEHGFRNYYAQHNELKIKKKIEQMLEPGQADIFPSEPDILPIMILQKEDNKDNKDDIIYMFYDGVRPDEITLIRKETPGFASINWTAFCEARKKANERKNLYNFLRGKYKSLKKAG